LEIGPVVELARKTIQTLEAGEFRRNPWGPEKKPKIQLPKVRPPYKGGPT
jgi:hypothetical protein